MKLLVSGTRHKSPDIEKIVQEELTFYLREWRTQLFLILGGAEGVDTYAENFAINNRVDHVVLYAKWAEFGKAAGAIRNREMFKQNPDEVICFPAPDSKGTLDVAKLANNHSIKPRKVPVNPS